MWGGINMVNEQLQDHSLAEFSKAVRRLDRIKMMLNYCSTKIKEDAMNLLLSKIDNNSYTLDELINNNHSDETVQHIMIEDKQFAEELNEIIKFIDDSMNLK
jgi:hypothetical protein